jgi:hypothetical protein
MRFDQPSTDPRECSPEPGTDCCVFCGDELRPDETRVCDDCEEAPRYRPCHNCGVAAGPLDDPTDTRPVLCNACHITWLTGE